MDIVIRRWKFTIAVLVIGLVGTLAYQFWYKRVPQECTPAIEMLDFDTAQGKVIKEKGAGQNELFSPAEVAAYQAWADGLADRAGKVTDPALAVHAVDMATLANELVGLLSQARDAAAARAPGAPVPPVAFEISVLNQRIAADAAALSKACKRTLPDGLPFGLFGGK